MDKSDEDVAIQQDRDSFMLPGTDPSDPLTFDPTQGKGTDAWQQAVKRQAELNARLRRN